MDIKESFKIGYITKTRGLKGEIQIFFEYDDPQALELELIFIEINRRLVPFFVSTYKLHSNGTGFFFLEDVDHIDKAQEILRKDVYLPNSKIPQREEGEFLITDLKDFLAYDHTYGELGRIIEINEYPQQFIATVVYNSQEILFPLNDDFIVEIDEETKELRVNLPEGLLDVYF